MKQILLLVKSQRWYKNSQGDRQYQAGGEFQSCNRKKLQVQEVMWFLQAGFLSVNHMLC
jgi:hypothetical protein